MLGLVALTGVGCRSSVLFLTADEHIEQPHDSTLAYSLYLIGDVGAPRLEPLEPTLKLLGTWLDQEGPNSAVVFLGDNIYTSGMPPSGDPLRELSEERIEAQLNTVKGTQSRLIMVPGNHDWGNAGQGGNPAAVRRQERYVEAYMDGADVFLPDNAFPGPVEVPLSDSLVLIAMDTQWWLENYKLYGETGTYELSQEASVIIELDDIIQRNLGKQIVIVGHHPLFTNGSHGGDYAAERRGRLIPVVRRYLGTPQDLSHRKYRQFINRMLDVFNQYEGLIYAAGHEHSLQYFPVNDDHFIVSGSGSKSSYVGEGGGAAFVSDKKGFARLQYYTDGSVWLEFWAPTNEGEDGERLYNRRIRNPTRPLVAIQPTLAEVETDSLVEMAETMSMGAGPDSVKRELPDYKMPEGTNGEPYHFVAQDSVTVAASELYEVGWLEELILGGHYRDVWSTPVTLPVIDLERTAGGLDVIKKGGGLQTVSLRLIGRDGDQYVLRSVDKDPEPTIPAYLRETVVQDIIQDQISAMHPFGAFALPKLAAAAGLYHTEPRLVVIPEDADRLGIYKEMFGGMVALFEIRPDEDQSDEERLGNPDNIIGTPKLFEELTADNDQVIDQPFYARNRLFDMWIGDWDRHADQWRWAAFEPYELDPTLEGEARTQGKVHRAIPRDRDFVFFKFDGPLRLLARLTGDRKLRRFSNFDDEIGDLYGLNYNGARLDIRLASELEKQDWVRLAEDLQRRLTDDVIERAVQDMPEEAVELTGEMLVKALKSRRDMLPEAARLYYKILARKVDVVMSDKHERFEVTRFGEDSLRVVVIKTTQEGEERGVLYERMFYKDETNEIRLYGLDGDDQFIFEGTGDGILVRAIGGTDKDVYMDRTNDGRGSTDNLFYDGGDGTEWDVGTKTRVKREHPEPNGGYLPRHFEYRHYAPIPYASWDSDDGFFFGGGVRLRTYGFNTYPFAASHTLVANWAPKTDAYNIRYDGIYTRLLGRWNGLLTVAAEDIEDFDNFYGFGNETDGSDATRERFEARISRVSIEPSVSRERWGYGVFRLGPRFEFVNVEEKQGFQEDNPTLGLSSEDFIDKYYTGFDAAFDAIGTDTLAATQSGAKWLNEVKYRQGVRHTKAAMVQLSSEVSYFYTFDVPRPLTLALRFGGAHTFGSFEFYQAAFLGGRSNLRGYDATRFAGRSSFYQNIELRANLFDFNAYLLRGNGGVYGFFDNGRVWADDEDSKAWHQGVGGGVWISPLYQVVLTGSVGVGEDGRRYAVRFGFLF